MTAASIESSNEKDATAILKIAQTLCLENRLNSNQEEREFLNNVLSSTELHALLNVHQRVSELAQGTNISGHKPSAPSATDRPVPAITNSVQVLEDVFGVLTNNSCSNVAKELMKCLQSNYFQSLLWCHDVVAQKAYLPSLPEPLEEDFEDEDEETVKIVQLVKSSDSLDHGTEPIVGATIKTDENTGKIVIARVMHGGAADRSGLIHPGDEVVEVNGISMDAKTPTDVLRILQQAEGTITFKIIPIGRRTNIRESKVRVRAHFDFNSATDPYIPCKEAGLDFRRGEILHIVSQDDPFWWQARKEGDPSMRSGLIPSRALQERRILHERAQVDGIDDEATFCSLLSCPKTPRFPPTLPPLLSPTSKTIKINYNLVESEDFDREEIPTYEEVAKLYPRPGYFRPLVLIGPPGVGRNELKRRLISLDPDKYKTTIPYTSRSPKPGEIEGEDYHFVNRSQMEKDIAAGRYIEYGEYKGNLYGTAADSIQEQMDAGYLCLLNPHYQALKTVRTADLKPYIIYIKPPAFEVLKETRHSSYARSTFDETNSRGFTDDEFRDMIRSGERIEFHYSHWFDEIIVNSDLSDAFDHLLRAVTRVESEPLWVPSSWAL
ncbi:MAGUK p55 subfamily member 7-like isoform X1 [Artemia franciscana]|uniref:MAGUK p55 subfamily member 7-like isoform X1 n=1 Tax=Artemia franciscana TaxID=6661 RepID=UPI0032DB8571